MMVIDEKELHLPKGMTIKRLRKLVEKHCIHALELEMGFSPSWRSCNNCILCELPWLGETLCYAVWQARIIDV